MKQGKINKEPLGERSDEKLPPVLSQPVVENPFKVPEGYFEELNRMVMQKIESLPDLERSHGVSPFDVPEGYFDSLAGQIRQRISEEQRPGLRGKIFASPVPGPRRLADLRLYAVIVSVAVCLAVVGIKYFTRTLTIDAGSIASGDIPESEFLTELDESTLVDAFTEQYIAQDASTDKSIEDYLIDNNVDLNSITDHL